MLRHRVPPSTCSSSSWAGGSGQKSRGAALLSALSRYSFGIYLAHPLFLWLVAWLGLDPLGIPPVLGVPVVTAAAVLLSLGLSWLLRKIPKLGPIIT